MGLNIQIKSATFTRYIGSTVVNPVDPVPVDPTAPPIPFATNLKGYWKFDRAIASAVENQVTGVMGTLIGNPSTSGNKLLANNASGFNTNLSLTGQKTLIVISRPLTPASAPLLATTDYAVGATGSEGLFVISDYVFIRRNSANYSTAAKVSTTLPSFIAASMSSTQNIAVFKNGSVLKAFTSPATTGLDDVGKFRIGGWDTANATPTDRATETYLAMIYDRALTFAEIQSVYDYLKTNLTIAFE